MISLEDYKAMINLQDEGHKLKLFPLFNKNDLARRWDVSRQVVTNWEKRHEDFPSKLDVFTEDNPQSYYPLYEVEAYEKLRGLNK